MCVSQNEGRAIKEKDIGETPCKKREKKLIFTKGPNNNTITRWEGEHKWCQRK